MNSQCFLVYMLPTRLIPSLNIGDIVICDNLSNHKVAEAREILASAGIELVYLPAYSPDLNPIKPAFSKLKNLMRKAATRTFGYIGRSAGSDLELNH